MRAFADFSIVVSPLKLNIEKVSFNLRPSGTNNGTNIDDVICEYVVILEIAVCMYCIYSKTAKL